MRKGELLVNLLIFAGPVAIGVILAQFPRPLGLRTFLTQTVPAEMLAWQSCLVRKYKPRLNYRELGPVSSR